MTEELYAQIMMEGRQATTSETEEAFEKRQRERIFALTDEETEIELAFLETKVREITKKVNQYVAEKQTKQNAVAV